ncbi:MAG: helix-turn-helix transcriptional regulator [Lentisphaerae bacterium]|nr:helix-turn-helix transcriptional regulator [Lentisphaerota bacterium]
MINVVNNMLYIDIDRPEVEWVVGAAVQESCAPSWRWDHKADLASPRTSWILVWLVQGGSATLQTGAGDLTMKRGDFMVMPLARASYHGRHTSEGLFVLSWLLFGLQGVREPIDGVLGLPFRSVLTDIAFAERIMARLLASSGGLQGQWLRVLLDEVRRQNMVHGHSEAGAQMHELGDQIQANPGRYRGLNDMLKEYHYSKDHLIRLFRAHHGVTPGEFLIRARMDSARGLLMASGFSVKQIAAQLGYADAFCFSRQFKIRTGHSPSAFRVFASQSCGEESRGS